MQITCNYCGKSGHSEVVCFKKNGFPPNYEGKNSRSFVKCTCTHCGRNGHTIYVCYRKQVSHLDTNSSTTQRNFVKDTNGKDEDKQEHAIGDQDMCQTQ